jgi:hypothetical protein
MTDTTMSAAFRAAGHELPGDKLFRLMREAILATGGIFEPTSDWFIKTLLAEGDVQLIWEFMAEVRMGPVKKLFGVVHHIVREEQRKTAGQGVPDNQAIRAGSAAGGDAGQEIADTQARRVPSSPPAGRPTAAPPANASVSPKRPLPAAPQAPPRGTKPTTALTDIARLSWLDRFLFDGRTPIGDAKRNEAAAAKQREECDARFIDLLISRLPPDNRKPIRHYITPGEADLMWNMAHQRDAA